MGSNGSVPTKSGLFDGDDVFVCIVQSRAQALENGDQVKLEGDLAELAREAGWRYPIYLTRSVWHVVETAVNNKRHLNDLEGVLWDILWMARYAAQRQGGDTITFTVRITGAGRRRNWRMMSKVGPTDYDDPTPAVTIMFPDDD